MDPEDDDEGQWEQMDTGPSVGPVPDRPRVILHFDLDCFYAQVEMIRNPALRSKPLGVQQKHIVVTCNYVARALGLAKLMLVKDALEKCPQLVLVRGEDLTDYRELSYKVTELLMSYCPLVERLGFDENFVDVTEMVESRVKTADVSSLSFVGHVYGHDGDSDVSVQDHLRLALGSVIAGELRGALRSRLGLTSCAGVASSKLLAKLVSGTFKPDQQSTLLPHSVGALMSSLSGPARVPGIGSRTADRLRVLSVLSVRDLQLYPLHRLAREFGEANAKRMQSLACGVDPSPVTPAGPPQSLSDEDSFRKISTVTDAQDKITDLLTSLTQRMYKDGRLPQTLRLTLRRSEAASRWFSRESRQCAIPTHTAHKILHGGPEAVPQLVSIVMKLLYKMVNVSELFHLTLLNVCFTNLQVLSSGKSTISSFFTHRAPAAGQEADGGVGDCGASSSSTPSGALLRINQTTELNQTSSSSSSSGQLSVPQPVAPDPTSQRSGTLGSIPKDLRRPGLPPDVDPDVFRSLPEQIQSELLTSFQNRDAPPEPNLQQQHPPTRSSGHGPGVPPDVDPAVFSQLPPDVRNELLTEWRRSKPALKTCSRNASRRPTPRRKPESRRLQNSSLLNYFKPS